MSASSVRQKSFSLRVSRIQKNICNDMSHEAHDFIFDTTRRKIHMLFSGFMFLLWPFLQCWGSSPINKIYHWYAVLYICRNICLRRIIKLPVYNALVWKNMKGLHKNLWKQTFVTSIHCQGRIMVRQQDPDPDGSIRNAAILQKYRRRKNLRNKIHMF